MKIRALNDAESSENSSEESSSDVERQPPTLGKEAHEEQCFDKYRQALLAIQDNHEEEARELLTDLQDELEDVGPDTSETLVQLKYSVLRNLGNLIDKDLEHYVKALEIDSSDICLWIRTGDRAMRLKNFNLARICYENALDINATNLIAIDRLVELYYILHLPFELYDMCKRALALNRSHEKASLMLAEAKKLLPSMEVRNDSNHDISKSDIISALENLKRKRQDRIVDELKQFKRTKLCITLDTARTQSLSSFGNYIIKIYERYAKQYITRNTLIDVNLNSTSNFSQHLSIGSVNSQSQNQNGGENQASSSQDIDMAVDGDGASNSENDKSDNQRLDPTTSFDGAEQPKSNSRSRSGQSSMKNNSSLSFAQMLFPIDLNDKRRSSRNRSNQDDTFSFKMKFDELNELLPECLRIGAIEQALQRRREEQQVDIDSNKEDTQEESLLLENNLDPVREDLIIKEVIETILSQSAGTTTSNLKLSHMFHIYLSKLATNKQITLPEAYAKIYKIYRKLCPLPNDVFIAIGSGGVELDELWFTLAANEIKYHAQECSFLLRFLEQMQVHLDDVQHKEFLVRLFLVLGLNLDYRYLELALQNIEEDAKVFASNRKIITRAHIKTLIDRKTEKLRQEAIEDSDNSMDIINRLAPKSENEMSDREIQLLCNAIKSAELWQRGLDILNQRNDLNSDIIIDTMNICLKNGAKMDAILASKLCKEAISGSRPTTWTCLYRGWLSVLNDDEPFDEETMKTMDKFFDLGHQTLGKKACCTIDKGEFLMLHIKHLLDDDHDCYEERDLLASMNCLFGYPSKKPASVVTHKAVKVPILWEYAEIIYHYLAPEELPTYMSLLRKVGITSELEALFSEIASAVPRKLDPRTKVHMIENFIEKGEPISDLDEVEKNDVTRDLFYFLADYHFKNKDFKTARQFYHFDLVLNPDRFDSWAASGLLRASGIDKALSEGCVTTEQFVQGPFHDLADSAIRCFEKATSLNPHEPKATLWIEYGNLTYNLTSLASRLYIYDDFEMDINGRALEHIDKLIARHKELYELAKRCFKSANELCVCDEVWLHYYMLGKIFEKADTFEALSYYDKADSQLFHEGAIYPRKISYHNPPELAYEAMEIHYRIHAASLKYLLTANEMTQEKMDQLKRILMNAQRSPFVELEGSADPKKSMIEQIGKDVDLLLSDTLDTIEQGAEFDELIFMCLHGMKRCLVRCDKNFKALFRLASYYRKINDASMAQDILISKNIKTDTRIHNLRIRRPHMLDFMAAPPDLNGIDSLFKDRKGGNLFFNIWRMPIEEIDRPGCFEHWMFKCTWLLIKNCLDQNDTNILQMIAFQLSRQPETSKKYLQDRPRLLLVLFAVKSIIAIITGAIERADRLETKQFVIREGMALADRFIKANVSADKMHDLYNQLQSKFTRPTPPSVPIC